MKTFKTILAAAAIAASLISCTKESLNDKTEDSRIKITFSGAVEESGQTKIDFADMSQSGKQIFKWIDTDQIGFFSWTNSTTLVRNHNNFDVIEVTPYKSGEDTYYKAEFSGYITESALSDTKGCAIYPYKEGIVITKGANPKFNIDIPVEQDGTGAKYNILAANSKADFFEDPAIIGAFQFSTAMIKINIPSKYLADKITSVKFSIDPKGSLAGSAFVAGNTNILPSSGNLAAQGGNSKSVTYTKTDGFISGDVYFTIRPLTNPDFFPIDMQFTFTNKDGKTQTLSKTIQSTTQIKQGVIYDFGTVTKLTFEGGGGGEKKVDFTLDLNYTDIHANTLLYTKSGETKTYLPGSAPDNASSQTMYFDQESKTYEFGTYGKLYYFNQTGKTNSKAWGVLLDYGKSYLKLPVIPGYKLATIKGMHGKGSTNDPQKMVATTQELTTGMKLDDGGVNIDFPSAGLGVMGTAGDVEKLTEPIYLYCRNTANPTESATGTNTTVIGRLVLGYVKLPE